MNALARTWSGYWFRPHPLFDLSVFRILVTASHVVWFLTFQHARVVEQLATDPSLYSPMPLLKLLTFSLSGDPVMLSPGTWELIFWIAVASGVTACLGLLTNVSLVVCAVTSTMIHLLLNGYGEVHHPEAVMTIVLTMLALSPCGRVLSLDQRLSGERVPLTEQSEFAGWPLKILFWMFALIYLSAFTGKLTRDGIEWLNGFTLQFYLGVDGLRWDRPFAVWLAQFHWLVLLLQVGVVSFQGTFWLTIFFPKLRWIYVPAGLLIHSSFWFILNAPFPQWIVCYAAFIPWSRLLTTERYEQQPEPA